MSHSRRSDYQPKILLPDKREALLRANRDVGNGYTVSRVRRDGEQPIKDGFTPIMNAKQRWLRPIKRNGGKLDEGLVAFMMESCATAYAAPVLNRDGEQEIEDGFLVYRLTRVGCRIYKTQDQIAREYICSRQHVNKQIGMMKGHGLIVNKGHGWYEFAAILCWRGNLDYQRAYRDQQLLRDGQTFTDGRTTLATEDMDGSDSGEDGEHSPQGLKEER